MVLKRSIAIGKASASADDNCNFLSSIETILKKPRHCRGPNQKPLTIKPYPMKIRLKVK